MKIASQENKGFTKVTFTKASDKPPVNLGAEAKHTIALHFPMRMQKVIYASPTYAKLAKLGKLEQDDQAKESALYITGRRKVAQAIKILLKDPIYNNDENEELKKLNAELIESLKSYLEHLDKLELQNPKKRPAKSRRLNQYESVKHNDNTEDNKDVGRHATERVQEIQNPSSQHVNKDYVVDRSIVDAEAYNACCAWLQLGKRAARVTTVVDELGMRSSNSELFPNYYSLYQYVDDRQEAPNVETLIDTGLADIVIEQLTDEDNDGHGGNIGFDSKEIIPGKTKLVRIDFDQSTFLITHKYLGLTLQSLQPSHYAERMDGTKVLVIGNTKVKDAFNMTAMDVRRTPRFIDFKPFQSPHKQFDGIFIGDKKFNGRIKRSNIEKDPKFLEKKHYALLRRVLINDEIYKTTAVLHIGSEKQQKEFYENKINKTNQLRDVLLQLPEFKEYLTENPKAIDSIVTEFKERQADLLADIQQLEEGIKIFENKIISLESDKSKVNKVEDELKFAKNELQKIKNELSVTKKLHDHLNENDLRKNYEDFKSACELDDDKRMYLMKMCEGLAKAFKVSQYEHTHYKPGFFGRDKKESLMAAKSTVARDAAQEFARIYYELNASISSIEKLDLNKIEKKFAVDTKGFSTSSDLDVFSTEDVLHWIKEQIDIIKDNNERVEKAIFGPKYKFNDKGLNAIVEDAEEMIKTYERHYQGEMNQPKIERRVHNLNIS